LSLRTIFDVSGKRVKIKELESKTLEPNFWKDRKNAQKIKEELSSIKDEVLAWDKLEKEVNALEGFIEALEELGRTEKQSSSYKELESEFAEKFKQIEKSFKQEELKTFLGGKYDKGSAVLSIYAGAGGIDAQDWANILLRMYTRYCEEHNFRTEILHQSFGEEGGTKSVTLEIKGKYAYGRLKKESGVHRLVRISPYSAQKLRHTSFARVEVLPILDNNEEEVEINPKDIKVDTYRASGPGGQYVNKRDSAIRITHIPTGIVVSCQSGRLQGENKEKALTFLKAKLYQAREREREKERKKLKCKDIAAEWGRQIRSYVMHPYKMVKDHRTGVEVRNLEAVLDGDLDKFIESEIKQK